MAKKHEIKNFWKRTWLMHEKFGWIGKFTFYPIIALITILGHFAFGFMHYLHLAFMKIMYYINVAYFKVLKHFKKDKNES